MNNPGQSESLTRAERDDRVRYLAEHFDIGALQMLCLGCGLAVDGVPAWGRTPITVEAREDIDAALKLAVEREESS